MEANNPKLCLTVHLGEDKDQPLLAKVNFTNHVGNQEVKQAKVLAKIGDQEIGPAIVAVIKYYVHEGREAQALKYLQEGFQQTLSADKRSPLQYITRKSKEQGAENNIYSEPGAICVRYKFPIQSEQMQEYLQVFNKFEEVAKFHIDYQIKGVVSHSHKNRTHVKVDYTYFNLTADQMIKSQLLTGFLTESEMIPPQVVENPFYVTAVKSRKLHLALRFKSFRQINKYFEDFKKKWDNDYEQSHEKKDFKYMAPGLFRQKAKAFVFFQDSVAASADITHQGEDIFFRLVKVYFKAVKKLFDL